MHTLSNRFRGSFWRGIGVLGGGILLAFPVRADLFETIDFTGTGAGYDMTAASFSFLSLHGAVQAGDINGDQLADVVILADGRVQANDFQTPGGWIPPTHYLYNPINLAVAGSSSPNVLAGIVGAPNSTFIQYTGGDLAWYQNNGNGYFEPCFVNLNTGNPPEIYNGKNLQVADLDGDSDNDIVVWASMETTQPTSLSAPGEWLGLKAFL
ncbi:MAG: VCBS repeat-containing protein [Elusimicrobia bacterium]|nr:VCBS repeat-containing protein [Elusimicrobiota bacterium]